jgi:hypothetical protein
MEQLIMGQFQKSATQYVTVAASQTTAPVGGINCYLESVTIIPASSAAGAVSILDGSTTIITIPTLAATGTGTQVQVPYKVDLGIRATSASTGFKITTGAAVSCIAVGRFTA